MDELNTGNSFFLYTKITTISSLLFLIELALELGKKIVQN